MEIKSSILYSEIAELTKAPQWNIAHTWDAVVHTTTDDFKALYVHWVKCYGNYTNNFSDEMVIAVSFPAGTYDFDIYKDRDVLELTLTRTVVENAASITMMSPDAPQDVQRYRAKIINPSSDHISQNTPGAQDKERLNATQTRDVKFQLIHPIVDYLRKMTSGGVFTDCRGIDAVRAFLGKMSRQASLATGAPFTGVDIATGFKEEKSSTILIPDHTPIPDIPKYINEESGGIYPTAFWYYMMGKFWFVYPKLDLQRYFNFTGLRLRVINVPDTKFPDSPKTFTVKDNLLTILATGDVKQFDLAEVEQENRGNGSRWIDPKLLFSDYVERSENKAIADAKQVITEVAIKPRRDSTNYTTVSDIPITARQNIEYSKLAARSGQLVQFVWESAGPELIFPGMPCSFVYLKNALEAEELTGIVSSIEWHSTTTQIDIKDRTFQCKAAVQIFVGRVNDVMPVMQGNSGKGSVTTN